MWIDGEEVHNKWTACCRTWEWASTVATDRAVVLHVAFEEAWGGGYIYLDWGQPQPVAPPPPPAAAMLANGGLDGPVTANQIAGWGTVAATLSIVGHVGRSGVLKVADDGDFSSVTQTVATAIGTTYFIKYDVWADPLDNTAGRTYCTTTDSNGLLDIHEGTDTVTRHGEAKLCPIENQPGAWQTVEGLYTATQASTTLALHSEGDWAAFFDDISMVEAPAARGYTYIGCFVDSRDRDLSGPTSGVATNPVDAAATCSTACSGFQYFGLQWENQCFCGASYGGQVGLSRIVASQYRSSTLYQIYEHIR